jgi:hypothetical protein
MYPTLVVALVARETSVLEGCASRARATGLPHGAIMSLRFAVPSVSHAGTAVSIYPSGMESDGIASVETGYGDCGVKQDEAGQV